MSLCYLIDVLAPSTPLAARQQIGLLARQIAAVEPSRWCRFALNCFGELRLATTFELLSCHMCEAKSGKSVFHIPLAPDSSS